MDTRIFRVTHDDGSWLNAELRIDINDGFAIIEARQKFGESVVSCEQLPEDHPAVRRHTERLIAESKGTPCKYAPEGRFCDNAINAELLEALEKRAQVDAAYSKLALMDRDPDEHERLLQAIEDAEDAAKDAARAAISKARGAA